MTKPDPLFVLVKSMTKAEKRHFKLSAVKYRSGIYKDYLRLFDAIEGQEAYDEEALITKFRNEPYFKKLKDIKLYLNRKILKSLRNFYEDVSIDMNLNNCLAEIEILYRKGLFGNCATTIRRAKTYAEKYEKLPYLLKIVEWEMKVADYNNDYEEIDSLRQKVISRVVEAVDSYKEVIELRRIFLEYKAHFLATGEVRASQAEEMATFDSILKHPLLEKELKSFQGENFRLITMAQYTHVQNNLDVELTAIENIIRLYDKHPHQIQEQIKAYFNYLVVFTSGSIQAKKFIKAGSLILKLKDIYQKNMDNLDLKNKMDFLCAEAEFLLQTAEFSQALHLIPKMTKLLEAEGKELDIAGEFNLYSSIYNVYFDNSDFVNAQRYLQKIINQSTDIRIDMQSSARIVNLILQYEQQEYEHLGYILRSTYRYLMKNQRLYEPEMIILDFLRKAAALTTEKQIVHALAELKTKILPHIGERLIIGFPLMEWIDSKLQKRELIDIVKEKYIAALAEEEALHNTPSQELPHTESLN